MVAPIPMDDVFLVLGPPRRHWPEPLEALVRSGEVRAQAIASLHEAAAQIAAAGVAIRALLLDPQTVMLRDLQAARLIARHTGVPVIMLPLTAGAGARAKEAADYGVLPWVEAAAFMMPTAAPTPARSSAIPFHPPPDPALPDHAQPSMPDNRAHLNTDRPAEIPVTHHAAIRYDDLDTCPLISPQEMQALLGLGE